MRIVILTGPAGSGKTTLWDALREKRRPNQAFILEAATSMIGSWRHWGKPLPWEDGGEKYVRSFQRDVNTRQRSLLQFAREAARQEWIMSTDSNLTVFLDRSFEDELVYRKLYGCPDVPKYWQSTLQYFAPCLRNDQVTAFLLSPIPNATTNPLLEGKWEKEYYLLHDMYKKHGIHSTFISAGMSVEKRVTLINNFLYLKEAA